MKVSGTFQMAILATLAVWVSGCAVQPRQPTAMQTQFSAAEHEPYARVGTASITGQAFLRQQGGGVVTCAGSPVFLLPATPFFREMVDHARAGNAAQRPPGATLPGIAKRAQCDAQGNFSFTALPAGRWLVTTQVSWVAGRYSTQQGGGLLREVLVIDGQSQQVLLTDADRMR